LPIVPPTRLSPLDLALVALYLVGITIFGLRFSRKSATEAGGGSLKRYFLAGNTIPWWAIGLSIVSAETSTLTIISIPGVAFAGDLGFLQVVLGYMLGRVVVALLFLPRYFRGEMLTAYQLIDQRFGHALHKLTAGLFLLTRAAAEGVRVFAISIVVGIAIGTSDILSIAIISALTLLYTFEGGMAAVIWTDVVQMALYVAGTIVAMVTLGHEIPGGWQHIHAVAAPLGKFYWLDFSFSITKSYTFWAGILGGTFLTMASHGTDQLMVQRLLAARNLRESRLALLGSGVVIFIQFTLFLLIGVGLFVFYGMHPQVFSSADRIFPTFIVRQMPHGVAGLLVAAILAAAMSNLSAALNSLASTTVVDFYLPWRTRRQLVILSEQSESKDPEEVHVTTTGRTFSTTLISRAATVFWAIILFAIAVYSIQAGGKGHVVETGLSIASVAYGSLLGVFLLGTLTRYATQTGAILGMICGLALNLFLWLTPANSGWTYTTPTNTWYAPIPHVAFTWYVLIGAVATFAIGSLTSLLSRRRVTTVAVVLFCLTLPLRAQSLRAPSIPAVSGWVGTSTPAAVDPTHHEEAVMNGAPDFSAVSNAINSGIAAKKLPGAVVVIGHHGQVVFHHAYGLRKLDGEPGLDGKPSAAEPMTEDTIFDMASLTKLLATTTAVLQLYEQHKLDLDAPVARYLPEFAQNGKEKITIRQLMTHYSGLPEDVSLKDDWGLKAPDKAEGIRRAMASVPYGPPGLTFKYSDINFITLATIVEQITGKSIDRYARQYIFAPLAMNDTSFYAARTSCGLTPGAYGHDLRPEHQPPDPRGIQINDCSESGITRFLGRYAPTAHDNEGTPQTNPDFDHLLRGTVHDPTTRRMGGVAGHAGVFSTASDAAKFCDALLAKLLRNEGPFPLTQATLRLATSPNEPATALANATIFTQSLDPIKGVASRGLGWDLNSAFSRPRGTIFPITTAGHPGSFGHTGFTGTSLWLDPVSDTYVVLLANAIHPRGNPPISPLRGEVATLAAQALGLEPPSTSQTSLRDPSIPASSEWVGTPKPAAEVPAHRDEAVMNGARSSQHQTLTGIDVLEQTDFDALTTLAQPHGGHLKLGLLTNQTGLDAHGHRTIDILLHAGHGIELTTLFTPEHGLYGKQDTEHLAAEQDATTHLPVISLYGAKPADRHPKQADLRPLDAVVIDLQDAGVRTYTYETLTGYFLEACAKANIPLIVLDRPNPIGGLAVQGPLTDRGHESYTDFMPYPIRHGLTLGELARYFNANATEIELKPELLDARALQLGANVSTATGDPDRPPATRPGLHTALTVVPMQHWSRAEYFDQTGLTFTPPSPNLRNIAAAMLLPALTLVEATNISVGRGTGTPFEAIGASFIDAPALAAYLSARQIPGIRITASTLTVAEDSNHYPGHGQTIPALHFTVTDRAAFDSPEFGLELAAALQKLYPKDFQLDRARNLIANAELLKAIKAGQDPREIATDYATADAAFRQQSAPYRLYH
jgi:SSS family transporter